jgi:NTE family protein
MNSSKKSNGSPRIGIALGGGGAKGFAHIGILKVLENAGIQVDIVTGTSIGAIVGAVYASGNLGKLESTATSIKLTELPKLLSPSWSLGGVFSGKNAVEMLIELAGCELIEDLKLPFGAVSADLESGELETFRSGPLDQALKASFAIPGIFTPVLQDNKLLVDGGTLEPVPVKLNRSLGADLVIAVDLFSDSSTSVIETDETEEDKRLWPAEVKTAAQYLIGLAEKLPLADRLQGPNALEIMEKTVCVSQKILSELKLKANPPDLVIAPAVSHVGFLDFHRGGPVVDIGKIAAEEKLEEINQMIAQFK